MCSRHRGRREQRLICRLYETIFITMHIGICEQLRQYSVIRMYVTNLKAKIIFCVHIPILWDRNINYYLKMRNDSYIICQGRKFVRFRVMNIWTQFPMEKFMLCRIIKFRIERWLSFHFLEIFRLLLCVKYESQ